MSFFVRRGDILEGPFEPSDLRGKLRPGALVAAEAQGPFEPPEHLFRAGSRAAERLAEGLELPVPALVGPGKVLVAWVVALQLLSALAIGAGLDRIVSAATSVVLALVVAAALLVVGHRVSLPFAALVSAAVAAQSAAAGGRGATALWAAHGLAALQSVMLLWILRRRRRALFDAIGVSVPPALPQASAGAAPPLLGVAVTYASAYALYLAVVYLYHQARFPDHDVAVSLVVYGKSTLALAVRASLYVILILASLYLLRATRSIGGLGLSLPRGHALVRVLGTAALLYFAVFLGLTAADALVSLLARAGPGAVAAFHRAIGEEARHSSAAPATAAILLYAGVLAPFGEELVFRGVLFRALRARMPVAVAIVLSALAFALLHPYRAAIYQVALVGILSGWVYHRTGSLWPSILAHAAWNTMLTLQAAA